MILELEEELKLLKSHSQPNIFKFCDLKRVSSSHVRWENGIIPVNNLQKVDFEMQYRFDLSQSDCFKKKSSVAAESAVVVAKEVVVENKSDSKKFR
ncbi:hypothetical protein Bca52824_003559 [Brassica carinata]|uniref:Uncharacterized protein n=1 Tax=Brassica carinata TaxID=52824 RepID=A0A8X8BBJ8_BRACI|nr:hypothetical protein Bca52824_003559 [Brassica carinata]